MLKNLLALIAVTAIAGTAWSADTTMTILDRADADFAHKAALGGMFEVRASDLAIRRGLTGDDKAFAQMMVTDHGKVNLALQSIADKKGIALATEPDDKSQAKLDLIGKATDKDIGSVYRESQIAAHQEAIALFTAEAEKGKDSDLRDFAAASLPTLKNHLAQAQKYAVKP